ncbi:MAG: hypothetical protein K9J25_04780 [Bacteroidales bacterium]|nr:hypothetical protein [Bacteroidales bacterium]
MKKTISLLPLLTILLVLFTTASCSKKLLSSTEKGSTLEYKFTGDDSYKYLQSSEVVQTIDFNGQDISTYINSDLGFTASAKGIANGSLILDITLDTLGVSINSMQGNMKEDISDLKGKSFMMTMDLDGDNMDLDEAAKLQYTVAGMQNSNLKASFMEIFPELPGSGTEIGYTWQDTDTVTINTETENVELILTTDNIIEAKEKKFGYDCYKVSYKLSGTRDGSSQTPQGMVLTSSDVKGTGHYYFAAKEGVIVSSHTNSNSDGSVTIPTGQNLPMYMTTKSDLLLK